MRKTNGENRLTREEQDLLTAIRRWFRYRTPENLTHVARATAKWIRSENRAARPAALERTAP